jgi:ribosome-binding protein aMBF1 (putative translation factor)
MNGFLDDSAILAIRSKNTSTTRLPKIYIEFQPSDEKTFNDAVVSTKYTIPKDVALKIKKARMEGHWSCKVLARTYLKDIPQKHAIELVKALLGFT